MTDDRTTAEYVALGAGVTTAVGSVLPWYRAGDVSAAFLTGNDAFTLAFGLLVCWIFLFEDWHRRAAFVVSAFGLLTVLVAGATVLELRDAIGNEPTVWLFVSLAGGVGLLVAGALGVSDFRSEGSSSEPTGDDRG